MGRHYLVFQFARQPAEPGRMRARFQRSGSVLFRGTPLSMAAGSCPVSAALVQFDPAGSKSSSHRPDPNPTVNLAASNFPSPVVFVVPSFFIAGLHICYLSWITLGSLWRFKPRR
jgi:hypothetical protein